MLAMLLALSAMLGASSLEDADESHAVTRFAVSLTDEGAMAVNLSAPGPDKGNLLLLQPSFSWRYGERWRFSSSLATWARTQGDTHAMLRVKETYAGFSAGD